MGLKFNVTNGREIIVTQAEPDGITEVNIWKEYKESGYWDCMDSYRISPGDFVMMLNWYKYQKEHGNEHLNF